LAAERLPSFAVCLPKGALSGAFFFGPDLGNIMKVSLKDLLLVLLLVAGVSGCASTYTLSEQQKEAIDYQNHKKYQI